MNVYKTVFSDNKILHCFYVCETASDYASYYSVTEEDQLTVAIIKAETPVDAYLVAETIVHEYEETHRLAAVA
jgi:hypothetical protein